MQSIGGISKGVEDEDFDFPRFNKNILTAFLINAGSVTHYLMAGKLYDIHGCFIGICTGISNIAEGGCLTISISPIHHFTSMTAKQKEMIFQIISELIDQLCWASEEPTESDSEKRHQDSGSTKARENWGTAAAQGAFPRYDSQPLRQRSNREEDGGGDGGSGGGSSPKCIRCGMHFAVEQHPLKICIHCLHKTNALEAKITIGIQQHLESALRKKIDSANTFMTGYTADQIYVIVSQNEIFKGNRKAITQQRKDYAKARVQYLLHHLSVPYIDLSDDTKDKINALVDPLVSACPKTHRNYKTTTFIKREIRP